MQATWVAAAVCVLGAALSQERWSQQLRNTPGLLSSSAFVDSVARRVEQLQDSFGTHHNACVVYATLLTLCSACGDSDADKTASAIVSVYAQEPESLYGLVGDTGIRPVYALMDCTAQRAAKTIAGLPAKSRFAQDYVFAVGMRRVYASRWASQDIGGIEEWNRLMGGYIHVKPLLLHSIYSEWPFCFVFADLFEPLEVEELAVYYNAQPSPAFKAQMKQHGKLSVLLQPLSSSQKERRAALLSLCPHMAASTAFSVSKIMEAALDVHSWSASQKDAITKLRWMVFDGETHVQGYQRALALALWDTTDAARALASIHIDSAVKPQLRARYKDVPLWHLIGVRVARNPELLADATYKKVFGHSQEALAFYAGLSKALQQMMYADRDVVGCFLPLVLPCAAWHYTQLSRLASFDPESYYIPAICLYNHNARLCPAEQFKLFKSAVASPSVFATTVFNSIALIQPQALQEVFDLQQVGSTALRDWMQQERAKLTSILWNVFVASLNSDYASTRVTRLRQLCMVLINFEPSLTDYLPGSLTLKMALDFPLHCLKTQLQLYESMAAPALST